MKKNFISVIVRKNDDRPWHLLPVDSRTNLGLLRKFKLMPTTTLAEKLG